MRRLDSISLVKFLAFMATLANVFEESNSKEQHGAKNVSSSSGKGKAKGLTRVDSCSLIIVSTLDGKLSALDSNNNGKLKWSLPAYSGPLLSSSLSSFQTGNQVRVIPSLDGSLYKVAGDSIESIPYTADSLLGSFHKLQDGSMLVGGKEAITCGVDPQTGKVRYVCSAEGCKLMEPEDHHVQNKDILVVKRTQQTVRAVDQRTGGERWNFSVGQQDVVFVDGLSEDGSTKCPMPDEDVMTEWRLRVSIPDGIIAAAQPQDMFTDGTEVVLWSYKFDAPVAAIWMLHGDYLHPVDLFSEEMMPGLHDGLPKGPEPKPIMYLGSHEGQVYIQPSKPIRSALDSVKIHSHEHFSRKPRAITWKPKLATSASRTPTVVSKEVAIWNPVEYPFDNGYYFFGVVQPVIPPHQRALPDASSKEDNKTSNESGKEKVVPLNNNTTMEYWKGAMAVVVVFAAFTQFFFKFLLTSAKQQPPATIQRLPSASVSTSTGASSVESIMQLSPSSGSLSSTGSFFSSRYFTDFEHELCLGKGGFGLVFQAKNKVDDCQYAIKRIRLPNCDEARAKVMREVKALAKLEHPGIVRYFNAWFEAPPVGWQEEVDDQMIEEGKYCGTTNESLSTGGLVMHEISPDDVLYKETSVKNGMLHNALDMKVRRRKTTSSSSKSRHSDSTVDDFRENRHNTLTVEEDLEDSLDVHQLENEAFLPDEESGSFGIEFAESSTSGPGNDQLIDQSQAGVEDLSESSSVVFSHSHNVGALVPLGVTRKSGCSSGSSSSTGSSSPHISFTTSGQSLLSGKHHKCKSSKCNTDALSAPLYLYIQMQLCQRESLKDWLKNNTARQHLFCFDVFEQTVNAVEYFHSRGMMHRDLKPSNIFFSPDGLIKVGDFGLVTATVQEPAAEPHVVDKSGAVDANHTGQVGTQLYMSPEQIAGKAYSYKVDIFSLGLILFELFHPFSTEMERIKVMSDVKRRVLPSDFDRNMAVQSQLVTWMLSDEPKDRPTATEVRTSDVYKSIMSHVGQNSKSKSE